MICSSVKRFFTSNLLGLRDWTPNRRATQNRGGRRQINAKFGRGTVGVGSAGWRVGGARPGEHSNASIKSQWRPSLRSLSPCYKTKWRSLIQVRHKDRRNSDHQTLDTTKRMVVENGKQQHRIRQVQTALRLRKRSKNRSA
ncbi:DUF4113 domain-containing protein [Stenotrophomonas maltophilia]|nr:DUF4113 domain-containing protein [Stenotrophomonas maltophilia]